MMKLEDGIPITRNKAGRPPKYPFRGMRVGQSFVVPYDDRDPDDVQHMTVTACRRRWPQRFRTSKQGSGVRVWRIK